MNPKIFSDPVLTGWVLAMRIQSDDSTKTIPSGNDCCRAIEAMAIEIVDLPIEHGDVP